MRLLVTALVCIAVLYGIDAYWFNGLYFAAVESLASQIFAHWR